MAKRGAPDFNVILEEIKACFAPLVEGEDCLFREIKCGVPLGVMARSPMLYMYHGEYDPVNPIGGRWDIHYEFMIALAWGDNTPEEMEVQMNVLLGAVHDRICACVQSLSQFSCRKFVATPARGIVREPMVLSNGKKYMIEFVYATADGILCPVREGK